MSFNFINTSYLQQKNLNNQGSYKKIKLTTGESWYKTYWVPRLYGLPKCLDCQNDQIWNSVNAI